MFKIVVSPYLLVFLSLTEEEYKRLSEALADEGSYNAVAFKYSADYYDPSQPTEEEDANREHGEKLLVTHGADWKNGAEPACTAFY